MPKALKLGAQNPREQKPFPILGLLKVFSFEFESTSLHGRTAWSTFEFDLKAPPCMEEPCGAPLNLKAPPCMEEPCGARP